MPKYTLLQMVQRVGQSINSDEISSIEETVESLAIKNILMDTLDDLLTRQDWEFLKDRPAQLMAGIDKFSLLMSADVTRLQKLRYRSEMDVGDAPTYRTLHYMAAPEFMEMLQKNNPNEAGVETVVVNGVPLYPRNNRPPRWYTSFDEQTVYVDSYDINVDPLGIDATKTAAIVSVYADLTGSTDPAWVAPLPEKMFALWYQEAVAEASVRLRQFEDPRAERRARRLFVSNSRDEPLTKRDDGSEEVNWGRR